MSLVNPTTILVALLLLYISSFILFAFVRVATGISIQRIGYFSLRRISYAPRDGVQIDIRGLGLSLHRPSFSQPTWVRLRLTDLKVTIDPKQLKNGNDDTHASNSSFSSAATSKSNSPEIPQHATFGAPKTSKRSETWKQLTRLKEHIKRLHSYIHWLAMVDVHAANTTLSFVDAGSIQVGSLTLAVDTRRNMVERGRLFRHKKQQSQEPRPAEWIINARNTLLAVDGREPMELLDNLQVNIHGHLYRDLEGLRDTSVAVKIGRLHFPYDDLVTLSQRISRNRKTHHRRQDTFSETEDEISFADFVEELDKPGSREEAIVQTVADSKEFVSSILRGIEEIQVALSFFRISRSFQPSLKEQKEIQLNLVTHEIGIDLHRMDPNSPAHRMYFQKRDVAHQALLAAISLSVSMEDGSGATDRLLYVPMATTTIKTTLPSKTVSFSDKHDASERNSNVLFANFVITSPSLDMEPRHVSQVLRLAETKNSSPRRKKRDNHRIISRLLPKAKINFSIQEPVVRFVLPIPKEAPVDGGDYNLLVSSISSVSLDIESFHSAEAGFHYSLSSTYRVTSHQLYYQTPAGLKHNLLQTQDMEVRVHLNATPEVCVFVSGSLNSFSVHMVNPQVNRGIKQVIEQIRAQMRPGNRMPTTNTEQKSCVLRRLPPWLMRVQFEANELTFEVAGPPPGSSKTNRGVALHLDSWTADYRAQKLEPTRSSTRRRTSSHSYSTIGDDPPFRFPPTSPPRRTGNGLADGRRLAVHIRGLEGFVIESEDIMEPEAFLSLPRCEVALSTHSDLQGPIFHINSTIKDLFIEFSLYRIYSLGIAVNVLAETFMRSSATKRYTSSSMDFSASLPPPPRSLSQRAELTTVDVRVGLVRVKGIMPNNPHLMLQLYGVAAGSHRWSAPFLRCQLARLHVAAPKIQNMWARILSMNTVRVDLRESKRRHGDELREERSIDVSADWIRIGVPHHLIMHQVFDNFTVTFKALKTLYERFKTNSDIDVLEKVPEGPKIVPRISLRSQTLAFQLEDDAFEWKLGCIYRVGLVEQRHRIAREEAFRLKTQKIWEAENRRASSRFRTHSAHPESRLGRRSDDRRRSASIGPRESRRSFDDEPDKYGRARYKTDGAAHISSFAKVSEKEAWIRLQEYNARIWKSKIDAAMQFQSKSISELRNVFAGADSPPEDIEDDEPILAIPNRPALMAALISDVHLVVDKPSFPVHEYSRFLYRIGKGMPVDMKFSLLIPMSIHLDMGEARVTLRDYPLDLLHIPALRPGQSPRVPSWSLQTDFVIAEEFRNRESTRDVRVCVVPPSKLADGQMTDGFYITVRRTIAPVKTYSEPTFDINTSLPTSITWCMSYQPVIQDMMKIIEGFTKPEIDPSERVGFWDKIRLSFHSRIKVRWKGDGDVHLRLKGSRDPYIITGFGAGFVMCWRKDVQWNIHPNDDPKEFMTVTSGEYVLAVPDYSHEARYSYEYSLENTRSQPPSGQAKNAAHFKKVMMKLSGSVKWIAGLVFERNTDTGRSFEFKSHYDVVLRNPLYIDESQRKNYDAYRGFRSNYIHLSVSILAPNSTEQTTPNYNTVHLTPRLFTHFFNWWSLFSGVMSLPVRQGPLWPGITKTSKKFGRHLATVKYKLLLSPLFTSHIYKHKDPEEYGEDVVTATGIKVRLANFKLDLHQRRERVQAPIKGRLKQMKSSAMRINRAELDFEAADFRAVSASIEGTTLDEVLEDPDNIVESLQQPLPAVDVSRFDIPDHDYTWIDMDDFVELDWILPQESNPKTKILPLAYTPRFTYFRQTDHGDSSVTENVVSQFGDEPTHECVMSQGNDPWQVQMDLIKGRLATLDIQAKNHEQQLNEHELQLANAGEENQELKVKHELLVRQAEALVRRRKFLNAGLRRLEKLVHGQESLDGDDDGGSESSSRTDSGSDSDKDAPELETKYEAPDIESASDFNNRFTIHNPQVKWNNSLRDIMVRYGHQVSQRRGFVYYMSQQAVKFISDIVAEQNKNSRRRKGFFDESPTRDEDGDKEDDDSLQDRIEQLLHDAKRFVNADDPSATPASTAERSRSRSADFSEYISSEFTTQQSYHLRLIAPQIQLQSDKNTRSVTLVTAKGMTLKVLSIMDKRRVSDDVSGLVQRRFSLNMDGAQFFVATQKNLKAHLQFYAGNKYGNAPGSAWPPWLTLEAMFDFELLPFGFSRIIQRTSASLRYDKYNNLRLKYNDEVSQNEGNAAAFHDAGDGRVDQVWVDFPNVRAICDSTEYYTIYIIVLDLLLYNEPLEKVRSEKLEKIMFASDFSDLRGAPETVFKLQERIRQLEIIKEYFQVQAHHLDTQGWQDRITLERDLANCEEELFFIMKAITTSQRRTDERTLSQSSASMRYCLSASDIVWHLMRDRNEPLVEFRLRNASYERTDNTDGSNRNLIEIQRLYALNLLENAIYPQMIVPYMDHKSRTEMSGDMMLRVQWYMLEAVAGIPVLDQFEVNLFPLKVQLERELGKKLFEYIFPGVGSNAFENGSFSPFMVKHIKPLNEEDEGEEGKESSVGTPDFVSTPRNQDDPSTGDDQQTLTGAGSIELRLQPTMTLPDNSHKARSSRLKVPLTRITKDRDHRLSPADRPGGHGLRPSTHSGISKKKSTESLRALTRTPTEKSIGAASNASGGAGESKRFLLAKGSKKEQTDDLTQMMSRASNYMILAHVKINDVVLCLSYKGRGDRNIEDVHDFVFRLPVLEYRNKTWSNLELALRLKKDAIKALISHAPAILGNKISHPRPSKQQQQRLRELASSAQALPASDTALNSAINLASATQSMSSRDSASIHRNNLVSTPASSSSSHIHGPSSLSQPSSSGAGTYPLAKSISYSSSSNLSFSREPSIMINDSPMTRDDSSIAPSSKRDSREERRPMTSHSNGSFSQDDSSRRSIRTFGRKLLHRHTAND
uniref:Uncharacterized protein n=1 Tax=Talaromyces marneffei PM1 TaxID=1077442 RepID=A0A093Y1H4_TALMA